MTAEPNPDNTGAGVMADASSMEIDLPNLVATERFGRQLGRILPAGAVIALNGPLAAGKTYLCRAIAEGLGILNPAAVTSPTFVLIQEYSGRCPIYHFDAYRLSGPDEFQELGSDEYLHGSGVCLIEWAERIAVALPSDRLTIELALSGSESRRARIHAGGSGSAAILRQFRELLEKPVLPV